MSAASSQHLLDGAGACPRWRGQGGEVRPPEAQRCCGGSAEACLPRQTVRSLQKNLSRAQRSMYGHQGARHHRPSMGEREGELEVRLEPQKGALRSAAPPAALRIRCQSAPGSTHDELSHLGSVEPLDRLHGQRQVGGHIKVELSCDPGIDHEALVGLGHEGGLGDEVDHHRGL